MQRFMLKSKIHRATVTEADLHYVGSITIDSDLMRLADIFPYERVQVVDIDNGSRLETLRHRRRGRQRDHLHQRGRGQAHPPRRPHHHLHLRDHG